MWMRATQRLRAHLPTLAQCRREGAGGGGQFFLGGLFLKLGVLGSGRECLLEMGRACCIFMYPHHRKGVYVQSTQQGLGAGFWAKETHWAKRDLIWAKSVESGQKCARIGKKISGINYYFPLHPPRPVIIW